MCVCVRTYVFGVCIIALPWSQLTIELKPKVKSNTILISSNRTPAHMGMGGHTWGGGGHTRGGGGHLPLGSISLSTGGDWSLQPLEPLHMEESLEVEGGEGKGGAASTDF